MSQLIARQVVGRINMASSLVAPIADVAGDLMQLGAADREKELARVEESRQELCAAYGFESSETRKPFAFSAGVAIIPLHGSLINRFGQTYGYVTGYNFIRSQLQLAMADEDVTAILLDCNSYGGEAAGCFETADEVFAARGSKPIVAVIDSNCYSACYAIASAADKIIITPTGGAGSIGVVAMHVSMEKMLEDYGYKVTFVYAGDHKIDGNPYQDLPANVRADIQRGVDSSRDKFVTLVARNRGLDEKAILDTQAAIYRADEALSLGLVDQVATPQNAVAALLSELSGSTETLENVMPEENAAAPGANTQPTTDAAAAAKAERERCSAILNCEEAKGNPGLANHLAFNTASSLDDAKAMLKAAAPAAAAEPAKAEAAAPAKTEAAAPVKAEATNPFQSAMNNDKHPNVGADAEGGGQEATGAQAVTNRILAAHALATGQKLGA